MLERYSNEVRILAVVRGRESDLDGFDVAQDLNGEAHCGYGGPGAMHLLRPDGYLAASGLGDVEAYLMRVYGPRAAGAPAGTRLEPCSSPNRRRPSRGS